MTERTEATLQEHLGKQLRSRDCVDCRPLVLEDKCFDCALRHKAADALAAKDALLARTGYELDNYRRVCGPIQPLADANAARKFPSGEVLAVITEQESKLTAIRDYLNEPSHDEGAFWYQTLRGILG